MSLTDKDIENIVKKQGREHFYKKCRTKEIDNFKNNFENSYAQIKSILYKTNDFLALLFTTVNLPGEYVPLTYNEFCQSVLKHAEIEVMKIDFSLLVMDNETIDSLSKRELQRYPDMRAKMGYQKFGEHIQKQIPKWGQERIAKLKQEEILTFHRSIISNLANEKLDPKELHWLSVIAKKYVKDNIVLFAEGIFPKKDVKDVKFNIRY